MSFGNKLANKVRTYRLKVLESVSTIFMYWVCRAYGIRLGAGCKFWGRMIVFKEIGSTIEFGDGCIFRSDRESNLIGVNRSCIVSSHSSKAVIKIGNNCGFSGASVGIKEGLRMGNNVQVGANTYITDFDWHALDPAHRDDTDQILAKQIVIEDNVWLGLNCIVLKGVHIGENSIIGAGSVVTKSIPPNSICAGNPCRVLRVLELPHDKVNKQIDSLTSQTPTNGIN